MFKSSKSLDQKWWSSSALSDTSLSKALAAQDTVQHAIERNVQVTVTGRPTVRTAAISWFDPACCRYGDQVWIARTANRHGVCVLSGLPIAKGDRIYMPRHDDPAPLNAGATILAIRMERALQSIADLERSAPVGVTDNQ